MVAVCGGEESCLPEFVSQLLGSEDAVGNLAYISAQLPGDVPCNGVGAAQHFKCVEAEAVGFILNIETPPDMTGG
jgi:hypothetical protein